MRQIRIGCELRQFEAEFHIADTGLGIEEEDLGKIFFVFRRGKNSQASQTAGKGIGLASVKSIVETYGGRIWAESRPDHGSTFHFTINGQYVLPLLQSNAAAVTG